MNDETLNAFEDRLVKSVHAVEDNAPLYNPLQDPKYKPQAIQAARGTSPIRRRSRKPKETHNGFFSARFLKKRPRRQVHYQQPAQAMQYDRQFEQTTDTPNTENPPPQQVPDVQKMHHDWHNKYMDPRLKYKELSKIDLNKWLAKYKDDWLRHEAFWADLYREMGAFESAMESARKKLNAKKYPVTWNESIKPFKTIYVACKISNQLGLDPNMVLDMMANRGPRPKSNAEMAYDGIKALIAKYSDDMQSAMQHTLKEFSTKLDQGKLE